jgi:hypothetical protein
MKVYLINTKNLTEEDTDLVMKNKSKFLSNLSDEEFMEIAKRSGDVYTERGFENAYNHDELFDFSNSYIRFI